MNKYFVYKISRKTPSIVVAFSHVFFNGTVGPKVSGQAGKDFLPIPEKGCKLQVNSDVTLLLGTVQTRRVLELCLLHVLTYLHVYLL